MENHIFTVYDSAASFFLEPFFAPSIEFAIRGFRDAVNMEGHQFAKHPQDYTLFHVGQWNGTDGVLEPSATAVNLGVAVTFVEKLEIA